MGDWKRSLAAVLREHGRMSADDRKRVGHETTAKRADVLFRAFAELRELGYKLDDVRSFRPKHVEALVQKWRAEGQATSTIHNKLSVLRVFAQWIGKPGIVRPTESYGVPARETGTEDKSWSGKGVNAVSKIEVVRAKDERVAMQLELQRVFGLRMAEAAQLRPHLADKGSYLSVCHGTKGGRDRTVPISTVEQREVLERAKALVVDRTKSLIPDRYSWAAWRQHYYYVVRSCGISREEGITSHGLRHEYLQNLYREQTGLEPPVRGGDHGQIPADLEKAARQEVAEQAGHSRPSISTHYLGRQR
jgi:integrase